MKNKASSVVSKSVSLLNIQNKERNSILEVGSFIYGVNDRLRIKCSENVFRIQLFSGKRAGRKAGLQNNEVNYYVANLIKSRNSSILIVSYDAEYKVLENYFVEIDKLNAINDIESFSPQIDSYLQFFCTKKVNILELKINDYLKISIKNSSQRLKFFINDSLKEQLGSIIRVDGFDKNGYLIGRRDISINYKKKSTKVQLRDAYNAFYKLSGIDYKTKEWNELIILLAKAKQIYDDPIATNNEIEEITDDLNRKRSRYFEKNNDRNS
ncbi:hypothetical protein [Enterococcus avium]|uniref:hypothetical protein n=1 Tax=Enterococcus avium TaxID=33945 RepID=UPI001F5AF51F|nr:hypothetical protein [Enterococcus avium]